MDFKEQVKSSVDIVKVVGEYVRLRRVGASGRWVGLCPFHQEKTPSFGVNQNQQFYHCFGCLAGGDVIKFVETIEGLAFPEALKLLAERNGIPIPQRTDYSDPEAKLRAALLDMHQMANDLYQSALRGPQGGEARAYLAKRGMSQELIDTFELGFAEAGGQALLRRLSERFSEAQLEASGLVRKRTEGSGFYDYFRGRLMFPIHNESGKVIGFGGRAMRDEDQPKYLNSPETPIYRKTSVLYNLHRARDGMRRQNRAVLVEGYMDVIGVYSAGVKEVIASCGTALTNAQVRTIHRHSDTVTLNFDPDTAGANAAERAVQILLDEGLHVKVVALDGGGEGGNQSLKLDPDEFVKRFGAEAYRGKLDSANGYFHWLADRARGRFDMRTTDGRTDAFKFLLPMVQKLPDKLERAAVVNDMASYLGVEPGLVLDQFKKSATDRKATAPRAPQPAIPPAEQILIQAMLASPSIREEFLPLIQTEWTAGFVTRAIFDTLRGMANGEFSVNFSSLEDRLDPSTKVLLHAAIAADETDDTGNSEEERRGKVEACLRRLESDSKKRHLDELRVRVREAEREGRVQEALEWMAELSRLERGLRGTL